MNNRPVNNKGSNPGTNSFDQVQSGLLLRSTSNGVQSQFVGNDRGPSLKRSRSAPQPAVLGSRMAVDPVVDRPASPSGSPSGSPPGSSLPPSGSQLSMLNPPVRDVAYGRNENPIPYHREDDHDLDSSDDEDDEFLWGESELDYQVNREEYDEAGAFLDLVNNWDGQQRTEWHDDDLDSNAMEHDYPDSEDLIEEGENDITPHHVSYVSSFRSSSNVPRNKRTYGQVVTNPDLGSDVSENKKACFEIEDDDEDDEFLWGESEHEYQVNRREYDETRYFLELANNWDGQQRTEWHDDDPDFEGIEYDYPDSDDLMEDDR